MVATAITPVLRKQERMVNAGSPPEAWAIIVIGQDVWKDRALLNVRRVVGIESDEEKAGSTRMSALMGLRGEVLIQPTAWVGMEHVSTCDA